MGHRNGNMKKAWSKLRTNSTPLHQEEYKAKTDATTNIVPGADQFTTESASFDYEMQPYRGHQGTYSQKREASEHKRSEYYKHMDSAKGNFSAAGDTLKNKGTYCTECNKFHED